MTDIDKAIQDMKRTIWLGRGSEYHKITPKDELIARLNGRLKGIDPGKPVNWKGL